VVTLWDHASFATPEVCEVILRPWLADKIRLRPESRITGHTGFLVRSRRLAPS
jgi:tRNA (adenine57-N1/adenine58-N1)-methyltransferase